MAEMRIVLYEYGPVVMDITDPSEQSTAGAYYNAVGNMLNGGSQQHSLEHYIDKVESFEGATVSGVIIQGPDQLIGQSIADQPLAVDVDELYEIASALDFSDSPYSNW
jgi:hypothetical protein